MQQVAPARRTAAPRATVTQGGTEVSRHRFRLRDVFGADQITQILAHQVSDFGGDQTPLAVALGLAGTAVGRVG